MTHILYIGDYAYSSWSLRGWLLLHRFGIPFRSHHLAFDAQDVPEQMAALGLAPAKTVPTLVTDDGAITSESLAIAEELASRHPEAGIWPGAPRARATARTLCAEMASGFSALRGDCPMNLRQCYVDTAPRDAVLADVARIETIWADARRQAGSDGPWLLGEYSAADAFFAPVAARIAGYSLPVSAQASAYMAAHLADPSFRRWRAMGMVHGSVHAWYKKPYATKPWPGPKPLSAHAVSAGPSENAACPYSGEAVTDFLELDGRIFGFCNPFCRDKTAADPEAWPDFMKLV